MRETQFMLFGVTMGFALFGVAMGSLAGLTIGLYIACGNSETLAAWVQAGGAILALVVAIFVPWRQHMKIEEERKRQDRLRATSLAIAILPEILALRDRLMKLEDEASSVIESGSSGDRLRAALWTIEPPEIIYRRIDDLYLLGPAGELIQNLICNLNVYRHEQARIRGARTVAKENVELISAFITEASELARKSVSATFDLTPD